LKTYEFSLGGYNFNDWSQVKELYLPTDVAMNPARTFHERGGEDLPHHLQHYFIPYGKVFIGLRATVQLTQTNGIGLLGTHFRWRKGVNLEWETGQSYWENIIHRRNAGSIFICKVRHTSGADDDEPGVGANWETYWTQGQPTYDYVWAAGQKYVFNQFVSHIYVRNGISLPSGYRCKYQWTHTAVAGVGGNEPGIATNWTDYWDIGDEMQADLSWPYYTYSGNPGFVPAIKLSEGHQYQFSKDVLGKFYGWHYWPATNLEGRALDALATTGNMKQDGILWGIEVDA